MLRRDRKNKADRKKYKHIDADELYMSIGRIRQIGARAGFIYRVSKNAYRKKHRYLAT